MKARPVSAAIFSPTALQLALAQRVEQPALEPCARRAASPALPDQMIGARIHRVGEPPRRSPPPARRCSRSIRLPVEPGRAGRRDLSGDVEIGAVARTSVASPGASSKLAQLDDRARRAIAGGSMPGSLT
jgi:hypothetical protein